MEKSVSTKQIATQRKGESKRLTLLTSISHTTLGFDFGYFHQVAITRGGEGVTC